MKIKFEKYNPVWNQSFNTIKEELIQAIGFINPCIQHIGSTSVEGLSAKPIIDILIGVNDNSDLNKVIEPLMNKGYVYYEKYNNVMPYRRFFVKHKVDPKNLGLPLCIDNDTVFDQQKEHDYRLAHIHVLPYKSEHWIRHIAFRDYLRTHPEIKKAYQQLKEQLSIKDWKDGNEYNEAKDDFIKREEKKAIEWYTTNMIKVISVREQPEYKNEAIRYIQKSWKEVLPIIYEDSITHCIGAENPLPQWYLLQKGTETIGCAGLITNDFISRSELYPWLCALYIEESQRGNKYPALLIDKAKTDSLTMNFRHMYLSTDLIGYYEKYGFNYIGNGYHPWNEESRIYEIKL